MVTTRHVLVVVVASSFWGARATCVRHFSYVMPQPLLVLIFIFFMLSAQAVTHFYSCEHVSSVRVGKKS